MKDNFPVSRRTLRARRVALLATTVAGLAAATFAFSPHSYAPSALADAAQAQNLTEKVQQLPQRPVGFADIVEKVKPAVISVRVKIDQPSQPGLSNEDDLPFPPGSPFERFFKRFGAPGNPRGHEVITGDSRTDLALIKVEGDNFPFVKLADDSPRVGDWVLAVGNPFGLGGTVTAGIVSARGRDIGAGPYDDFIQIDAPVNKGN